MYYYFFLLIDVISYLLFSFSWGQLALEWKQIIWMILLLKKKLINQFFIYLEQMKQQEVFKIS